MTPTAVIGLMGLLLCFCSCAPAPYTADLGERKATIAVWELEDVSPGMSRIDVGEILSARVSESLQKKGNYTVVERTRLLRVLEELHLGSSELAEEGTRLRIGRLVGARFMVFGGYQVVGKRMRLDLRLVEVETGKVRKAVSRTAQPADGVSGWLEAAEKAAEEF
jgi:curli biogenesis system outer membrane secretion channel CsgG